jgi:hypothetical protein
MGREEGIACDVLLKSTIICRVWRPWAKLSASLAGVEYQSKG